jgi:hypothetical protein
MHRRARRSAQPLDPAMTYSQVFRHVAMRAMLALLAWSVIITVAFALVALFSGNFTPVFRSATWFTFCVSFLVGSFILVAYGVPLYSCLSRRGRVEWSHILLLGAIPGVLSLALLGAYLGALIIVSGLIVSVTTHLLCTGDNLAEAGSNKSLERTRNR